MRLFSGMWNGETRSAGLIEATTVDTAEARVICVNGVCVYVGLSAHGVEFGWTDYPVPLKVGRIKSTTLSKRKRTSRLRLIITAHYQSRRSKVYSTTAALPKQTSNQTNTNNINQWPINTPGRLRVGKICFDHVSSIQVSRAAALWTSRYCWFCCNWWCIGVWVVHSN